MAESELRKLKDQAARAVEKRNYERAAECYAEIAAIEADDPDWQQRAGEAFRKAGNATRAAEHLATAAAGYAAQGQLLKAIAVCKVVLQLDARHTETQNLLAQLFAKRDGDAPEPPPPVAAVAAQPPRSAAAPPPSPPPPSLPPPSGPPPSGPSVLLDPTALLTVSNTPQLMDLDEVAPTVPRGAPLEVVPLRDVLGGRVSDAFAGPEGGVFEIALDELEEIDAVPDDPDAVSTAPDSVAALKLQRATDLGLDDLTAELAAEVARPQPTPTPAKAPSRSTPTPAKAPSAPVDDEMDFSAVMDDAPSPKPLAPAPAAADSEMDFSSVMEDEPPAAVAPPSRPTRPAPPPLPPPLLPTIPLFSSLGPAELRRLIERVELRDVAAGTTIVRQGAPGGSLFVIVRGEVQVTVEKPRRHEIARLSEGSFFGELGVLTDLPRSATVMTIAPSQVLEVSRELVSELVANSPDVLRTLLRFFRDRMLERLVKTSALFTTLSEEDGQALVQRFRFLEFDPSAVIVREGELSTGLFLLLCGEAAVEQAGTHRATLAAGDLFGEMSLLQRTPAVATIRTRTKCWALALPRPEFQELMMTHPQLLEHVGAIADARREQNASDTHVRTI